MKQVSSRLWISRRIVSLYQTKDQLHYKNRRHISTTPSSPLGAHESQTLTLPDSRILGFSTHGASTGLPIFIKHGLPGSRIDAKWFHEIDQSLGLRVIGIDRPGLGLSSPHEGRGLMDWPSDVKFLAKYLGIDKFKVLGASGGGPVEGDHTHLHVHAPFRAIHYKRRACCSGWAL